MGKKSVRAMSRRQRQRHSLSAKTFRSTMLGCILLGLVTLVISLTLYSIDIGREAINQAANLTHSARMSAYHGVDSIGLADRVMEKYRSLTPEQRAMTGTEAYRALFAEEEASPEYDVLVHMLGGFLESGNVFDLYLAMYDEETAPWSLRSGWAFSRSLPVFSPLPTPAMNTRPSVTPTADSPCSGIATDWSSAVWTGPSITPIPCS